MFISNRKGMTLIEIMIVLAIIAGISALLLPRMQGATDKAKVKETKIHMGQLSNALQMYYTDCNKYPQTLEGLTKADPNCSNWGPEPYIKVIKDRWDHDYVYEVNGGEYHLKSLGKDGREGGSGYDTDITLEDLN